jgi:hypothetical protein
VAVAVARSQLHQSCCVLDAGDQLVVVNRAGDVQVFRLSVYQHQPGCCLYYLDDARTKSTDLKLLPGTHAALTVGRGMLKSKVVQAAMRMQLGREHSVALYASHEARTTISALAAAAAATARAAAVPQAAPVIATAQVLAWTLHNTAAAISEGALQWASQGLSYAHRAAVAEAHRAVIATGVADASSSAKAACTAVAAAWQDAEVLKLTHLYGQSRQRSAVPATAERQLQQALNCAASYSSAEQVIAAVAAAGADIVQRTERYAGHISRFAAPCDEEQERELEQELEEERKAARPLPALAHAPHLHPAVAALADGVFTPTAAVFRPLGSAFSSTQLQQLSERCAGWLTSTWVTQEFVCVVQKKSAAKGVDAFLRPPCWAVLVPAALVSSRHLRLGYSSTEPAIVLISPFEANALMPAFRAACGTSGGGTTRGVTLRMYAPRNCPQQQTLLLTPALALPLTDAINVSDSSHSGSSSSSSASSTAAEVAAVVTAQQQAQLAVFSEALFFATAAEQSHYCAILGLCPHPRTDVQEAAFSSGYIERSGFVLPSQRAALMHELVAACKFKHCPVALAENILHIRGHLAPFSYVTSVLSKDRRAVVEEKTS